MVDMRDAALPAAAMYPDAGSVLELHARGTAHMIPGRAASMRLKHSGNAPGPSAARSAASTRSKRFVMVLATKQLQQASVVMDPDPNSRAR